MPTSLAKDRIEIRPETAADVPASHAVTLAAFEHAAHSSHVEQFIVAALHEAGQLTVSLVATDNGMVVGHIALSADSRFPSRSDARANLHRQDE